MPLRDGMQIQSGPNAGNASQQDHTNPLSGTLEWIEPKDGKLGNQPPRFKLCGLEFSVGDIESVVQEKASE
jgi:hypothetical protein